MVVIELQKNGRYKLVTDMKTRKAAHGWRLEE
jgi:hypothetical protein